MSMPTKPSQQASIVNADDTDHNNKYFSEYTSLCHSNYHLDLCHRFYTSFYVHWSLKSGFMP